MKKTPDGGRKRKSKHALFWIIFLEVFIVMIGVAFLLYQNGKNQVIDDDPVTIEYSEIERQTEAPTFVPRPDIDQQLLTINEKSRPGEYCTGIDYIVIHYLANPGTTAQQNRDYFESLKDFVDNVDYYSMSANYVVGIEGEIIQCVPDGEIAYASNEANKYSISIENCHPNKSGRFTDATYESLVQLTAYLSDLYDIDRDHIIRHYDVTGKPCPLYYVVHEDKWEKFRDDVIAYREECREEALAAMVETEHPIDELTAFLESNAGEE